MNRSSLKYRLPHFLTKAQRMTFGFCLLLSTAPSTILASDITLDTGWNLKYPYTQNLNQAPQDMLITPKEALDIIYVYDYFADGANGWYCYSAKPEQNCTNAFGTLSPVRPMWLKMNAPAIIKEQNGSLGSFTYTVNLANGWNFARPLSFDDINDTPSHINDLKSFLSDTLRVVDTNSSVDIRIYAYDTTNHAYKVIDNGYFIDPVLSRLSYISKSDGLWIKAANLSAKTEYGALSPIFTHFGMTGYLIESNTTQALYDQLLAQSKDKTKSLKAVRESLGYANFPNLSNKDKLLLEQSVVTLKKFILAKRQTLTDSQILSGIATSLLSEQNATARALGGTGFLSNLLSSFQIDSAFLQPVTFIINGIANVKTGAQGQKSIEAIKSGIDMATSVLSTYPADKAVKAMSVLKADEVIGGYINDGGQSKESITANFVKQDNIDFLVSGYDSIAAQLLALGIPSGKIDPTLINRLTNSSSMSKSELAVLVGVDAGSIKEFTLSSIVPATIANLNIHNPYVPVVYTPVYSEPAPAPAPSCTESAPTVSTISGITSGHDYNRSTTLSITSNAADSNGLSSIVYILDNNGSTLGTTTAAATVVTLNTANLVNGSYTVRANVTGKNCAGSASGEANTTVSFTVTGDITPNAFSFTSVTNAALSTEYNSTAIVISGLDTLADINITGGKYMLNRDGNWTTVNQSAKVKSGDVVELNVTSSGSNSTDSNVTLRVGTVSAVWNVTTLSGGGGATAPVLSAVSVTDTNSTGVTFTATSDKAATGYYIVLPAGFTAPAKEQVAQLKMADGNLSEISGSASMSAGVAKTFAITGLYPAQNYYIYFTAKDSSENNATLQTLEVNATGSRSVKVLKTGQTTSYATNDDGAYQKGLARSYTRDVNSTVTDNVTGLQWQDDAAAASTSTDWTTATTTTCQALTLGGYTDWRLPTETELSTLPDYNRSSPSISTTFQNTAAHGYWSSTTYAADTTGAWDVYFYDGGVDADYKTNSLYVRCVRGQ